MVPKISIVGAGIAGLILGQILRRRQITAVIWEKSKQIPALQNFGITLQPEVHSTLVRQLDIDDKSFRDCVIKAIDGEKLSSDSHVRVNRSAFLRTLAKDLDVRWDHKLTGISRGSDARHKLTFESQGQSLDHESDIVIAADGVHSAVRNALALDKDAFKLEVLPYVVYNGKRRLNADALPDGLARCLDSTEGVVHSVGNIVLRITSGYFEKNEIGINYTLSRPAEKSDDELLARGNNDAETLARQFVEEAGKLKDLPEPFKTVFDRDEMKKDRLLHWLMRSALIDARSAEGLAKDGIILLGDAAHPQPILGGAGANAAITDALKIAETIGMTDSTPYHDLQAEWRLWRDDAEKSLRDMHTMPARASM